MYKRILFPIFLFCFLFPAAPALRAQEEEDEPTEIYAPPQEGEEKDSSEFALVDTDALQPAEKRRVSAAKVDRLKRDDDFWYVDRPLDQAKPVKASRGLGSGSVTAIWTLVILAFAAIIIFFLASSNVRLFRRKSKGVGDGGEGGNEGAGEDLMTADHDRLVQQALRQGDHRRAVRYLYLRTLKDLSLNELIQYRQEHTDSDYLRQLQSTSYFRDFSRLSRHFQYAWYGKRSLKPELYDRVQTDFDEFKKRLNA